MKRILLTALLFLSLMVCLTSSAWGGGLDDAYACSTALKNGDYDNAIRFCTNALASGELGVAWQHTAYTYRGRAWYGKGDYDKAIADFTKAIEVYAGIVDPYYYRGLAWGNKRDFDKAIADFTKAAELDSKNAQIYYMRGLAWGAKSDYDRAIADFTKVIELDPQNAKAYQSRGLAGEKKGYNDKAKADYEKARAIDPSIR
jgi:tetratricopeptide (TPR) repeat protein